jgi:hypothetical protein
MAEPISGAVMALIGLTITGMKYLKECDRRTKLSQKLERLKDAYHHTNDPAKKKKILQAFAYCKGALESHNGAEADAALDGAMHLVGL